MTAEDREVKLKRFMDYSRCTREYATVWLNRHDWNIEAALDAYWRECILIY